MGGRCSLRVGLAVIRMRAACGRGSRFGQHVSSSLTRPYAPPAHPPTSTTIHLCLPSPDSPPRPPTTTHTPFPPVSSTHPPPSHPLHTPHSFSSHHQLSRDSHSDSTRFTLELPSSNEMRHQRWKRLAVLKSAWESHTVFLRRSRRCGVKVARPAGMVRCLWRLLLVTGALVCIRRLSKGRQQAGAIPKSPAH